MGPGPNAVYYVEIDPQDVVAVGHANVIRRSTATWIQDSWYPVQAIVAHRVLLKDVAIPHRRRI